MEKTTFNPENWPTGTKIKKTINGKKEIVLPQPTDMKEFDRKNSLKKKNKKTPPYPLSAQHGQRPRRTEPKSSWDDIGLAQKYYRTRQERLRKQVREERKFKFRQQSA